jgi:hypothetical protein
MLKRLCLQPNRFVGGSCNGGLLLLGLQVFPFQTEAVVTNKSHLQESTSIRWARPRTSFPVTAERVKVFLNLGQCSYLHIEKIVRSQNHLSCTLDSISK